MKSIKLTDVACNCEGISRRDLLRVGVTATMAVALPEFVRGRAEAGGGSRGQNCILLFMSGGPSHLDAWDPKPDAPSEVRGEFRAIETNVAGIRICEHLPRLARLADRYAVVRSVTGSEMSHERACQAMLTGGRSHAALECPGYGSVVAWAKGSRNAMPPYVGIPTALLGGGSA